MKWPKIRFPGLKRGNAPSSTAKEPAAPPEAPSTKEPRTSTSTFATAVMELADPITSIWNQKFSTSARPIGGNGGSSMEWSENLQAVAEQPWELLSGISLGDLSEAARDRLVEIAEGRDEPVEFIIHEIALWHAENESEYCDGPLIDGVNFYLQQELV